MAIRAKYISVIECMLFDALQRGLTPEQRKIGLYAISLEQLANKGGQIGPKKIRVHKWLTDNDWDIVQTVVLGTKFSGQNSLVKLTALATIQNSLQVPIQSLSAATTDEEIDAYLSGDDVSNIALFDHLYPEYNLEWREDKLKELFDWARCVSNIIVLIKKSHTQTFQCTPYLCMRAGTARTG